MPPKKAVRNGGAKPKAHVLAPKLPAGTVLKDLTKQEWKIGTPIGSGGFGLLYMGAKNKAGEVGQKGEYVIKIEPLSNGPLFCELHFYQRVAKTELINEWKKSKKLTYLGVPKYIASGLYEDSKGRYRFMVMERFGTDLQKQFEANKKQFPRNTVLKLGLRMLDVLEYIHAHDYCHADIKASNLLMGYTQNTTNQVYLVDYGLAFRFCNEGKHKEYKIDPKWKHNGTIEFTSRDAHNGLSPARRGDLEIMGYCMLQWLCGRLPWEDKLSNCEYVQDQKKKYMDDIPALMKKCFPSGGAPAEIQALLAYVNTLDYHTKPDYARCKKIFLDALKKMGSKDDGKMDFTLKGASQAKTPRSCPPCCGKATTSYHHCQRPLDRPSPPRDRSPNDTSSSASSSDGSTTNVQRSKSAKLPKSHRHRARHGERSRSPIERDEERPSTSRDRSSTSLDRPSTSRERPSTSRERSPSVHSSSSRKSSSSKSSKSSVRKSPSKRSSRSPKSSRKSSKASVRKSPSGGSTRSRKSSRKSSKSSVRKSPSNRSSSSRKSSKSSVRKSPSKRSSGSQKSSRSRKSCSKKSSKASLRKSQSDEAQTSQTSLSIRSWMVAVCNSPSNASQTSHGKKSPKASVHKTPSGESSRSQNRKPSKISVHFSPSDKSAGSQHFNSNLSGKSSEAALLVSPIDIQIQSPSCSQHAVTCSQHSATCSHHSPSHSHHSPVCSHHSSTDKPQQDRSPVDKKKSTVTSKLLCLRGIKPFFGCVT